MPSLGFSAKMTGFTTAPLSFIQYNIRSSCYSVADFKWIPINNNRIFLLKVGQLGKSKGIFYRRKRKDLKDTETRKPVDFSDKILLSLLKEVI